MPKIVGSGLYNNFLSRAKCGWFPANLAHLLQSGFHTGKDGLQNWKQSGKLSTNQCCLSDSPPSVLLCHGDFPVSRNGQSDGNIKVGLRIADAGRVYDSLRSGLVINQPLKNRVLHELGIHQRSKLSLVNTLSTTCFPPHVMRKVIRLSTNFSPARFHYRQRFIRPAHYRRLILFPLYVKDVLHQTPACAVGRQFLYYPASIPAYRLSYSCLATNKQ